MIDDVTDIRDLYNYVVQDEATRLERHQLERDITWRYLDEYLPPKSSILEIGASTGAYTVGLAQRGHRIAAVDLAEGCLAECRRRIEEAGLAEGVSFTGRRRPRSLQRPPQRP